MIVAAPLARTRALAARREATTWVVLGSFVVVSSVVRIVLAHWHTAPRYFPDEYIYSALSHSLVHGHLAVRDQPAHFYGILQPILAAPIWQLFPVEIAYRLVQAGNAVAASLVVVPLWFLGRELQLGRRAICLVCAFALVMPMLAMIPVTISDFVAYPLAIGGVAAAVRALKEPTTKRQAAFLALAFLATLARTQYFVLVPAYLVAALALDRRRAPRRHPVAFLAVVPAVIGAVLAATGYYSIGQSSFNHAMVTWVPLEAFILAATGGVVIVPGAIAAIVRPANRPQAAFAWMTSVVALLTLVEASVPGALEGRFKGRYLFALMPLIALAFAVYRRNGRSHRWIVLVISVSMIAAAAKLPFSYYDAYAPRYDAQSMTASWLLKQHIGASGSSLVIALFITVASLLAIAISVRPRLAAVALPIAIAVGVVTTAAAVHVDFTLNSRASDPGWIDSAAHGASVTAIATPSSDQYGLIKQLYWNPGVDHEVALANAVPTDVYVKKQIAPAPDGSIGGIGRYFLFDRGGTQAVFAGAATVATNGQYELLRAGSKPRFRLLVEDQLTSGWLAPVARLRAWQPGQAAGTPRVEFTLSLPAAAAKRVPLRLGTQTFVVRPGDRLQFSCASRRWPVKVLFVAGETSLDSSGRPVSVHLSGARVAPGGPATTRALRCTDARR